MEIIKIEYLFFTNNYTFIGNILVNYTKSCTFQPGAFKCINFCVCFSYFKKYLTLQASCLFLISYSKLNLKLFLLYYLHLKMEIALMPVILL